MNFTNQVIDIKKPIMGETPYPINGTGKFPNRVEIKIIIKYIPMLTDNSLYFSGEKNINGNGNITREITPKLSHNIPIFASNLTIFST